jgi:predicted transcriptional regulator
MNVKLTVEMDEEAARTLEKRAAERGVSVGELIAELASARIANADEIAELERRWAAVEAGAPVTAHDKVIRWLTDWGTPSFRPWPGQ